MTTQRRMDSDLPRILGDIAAGPYPDYIDDVLSTTAQRRQRPAWTFPERWLPMDIATTQVVTPRFPLRAIGLFAILALALAAAVAVYIGAQPKPAPIFGPAANGLIPYAIDGDLFLGDPVTGETMSLLAGPEFDFDPAHSRDGTRILFARREDPTVDTVFSVYVMDPDGSDLRLVTPEPLDDPHWWDWTPTGDLLTIETSDRFQTMFVYDVDGTEPRQQLTDGMEVDVPSFRPPNSDEILFRGSVNSQVGLFVMDADGTNQRPLIPLALSGNGDYTLREARYSPDGSQIAFHQWDDVDDVMRLYVMDPDGSNRRELGADPAIWFTGWPVWSNDGTRIAVQRGRVSSDSDGFDLPYAIIDVETGTVTETGPAPGCCRVEWAPDDTSILFLHDVDGVATQMLLDPAGGPAQPLPWTSDSFPTWQRRAD